MSITRRNQQHQLFDLFKQVVEGKTTRDALYSYAQQTYQKDFLDVLYALFEIGTIDCVIYEDGRTSRWFLSYPQCYLSANNQ